MTSLYTRSTSRDVAKKVGRLLRAFPDLVALFNRFLPHEEQIGGILVPSIPFAALPNMMENVSGNMYMNEMPPFLNQNTNDSAFHRDLANEESNQVLFDSQKLMDDSTPVSVPLSNEVDQSQLNEPVQQQ